MAQIKNRKGTLISKHSGKIRIRKFEEKLSHFLRKDHSTRISDPRSQEHLNKTLIIR